MSTFRWPELRVEDWEDTRDTLHLWMQILGKVQLVSTSLVNHWWNVSFEVSARGLRTHLMRGPEAEVDGELDFVEHRLVLRSTNGEQREIALEPKTVAAFWQEVQEALPQLGAECSIDARPNELATAIPFAEDTEHKSYDAASANAFWRQLVSAENVFSAWRAGFAGKDSPVQVFWGSMDLACARFSGRPAPKHTGSVPNCPPWVMQEAESRENSAAGFWPGGSSEGTFYAYVYPEPDGYRDGDLSPATFDTELGEWVLPYETVRTSDDPDQTLMDFLDRTYAKAADLAGWDRKLLEVDPHRLDRYLYPRGEKHWPRSAKS